jgi:hypothetical protein
MPLAIRTDLFAEQYFQIYGAQARRLTWAEWWEIFPRSREAITALVGRGDILIYAVSKEGELAFHVEPVIVEHDELHRDNVGYDE